MTSSQDCSKNKHQVIGGQFDNNDEGENTLTNLPTDFYTCKNGLQFSFMIKSKVICIYKGPISIEDIDIIFTLYHMTTTHSFQVLDFVLSWWPLISHMWCGIYWWHPFTLIVVFAYNKYVIQADKGISWIQPKLDKGNKFVFATN